MIIRPPIKEGFFDISVFINMNESNFNMDLMDRMIKKFMSAMVLRINIEDTNYSDYKYFAHQRYGTVRIITYIVQILNKKNEVIYIVDVNWLVIGGKLKEYNFASGLNPFAPLGFDNDSVEKYLTEKTRGMAEEWIKTFPARR